MYNNDRTPVRGLKWTFFTSEANYAVHLGATSTLQGSTFTEDPASLLKVQVDHAHSARRAHDDESLNLTLRRHTDADPELWKQAMKRPKLRKQEVEKGLGKKRKNMEVDEMGDLRGRIHVGRQDLGKLQTRKMKGLKAGRDETDVDGDQDGFGSDDEGDGGRIRKKARAT